MIETAFTRLVGCTVPIQQAGMGGVAGPELAVAVAQSGALGMLGMPQVPAPELAEALEDTARPTSGAIGINFLVPFLDREAVEAAAPHVRLVEFFYGAPDPSLIGLVHAGGALAGWQVGSLEEARHAVGAGCDLVTVQGTEAGGHVRGKVGLLPLLDAAVEEIEVPVVAAGGLGTARAVAAVLAAGAAAARIGTRFVATTEADAHRAYVDALIGAGPEDTVLTTAFSVLWPEAPHRVLRSCIEAAEAATAEILGEVEVWPGATMAVPRRSPVPPARRTTGDPAAMALYAGESVGAVRRVEPAGTVVRELADGAEALLAAWSRP